MTILKFRRFNIEAYKPGKSNIKKLKKIIKLSANESALGVSPKVKKIILSKKINFFRYPDGTSKKLRNQIRKELKKTHKCKFNFPFIWERWDRIT